MSTRCPQCGALRPNRLTATPVGITVWVQEPIIDAKPPEHEVWLRPRQMRRNDAAAPGSTDGWVRLSRHQWFDLRDTIDKYFAALAEEAGAA